MGEMIEGVLITPLKKIYHPKGDIFHALKNMEVGYEGFGEAYFQPSSRKRLRRGNGISG